MKNYPWKKFFFFSFLFFAIAFTSRTFFKKDDYLYQVSIVAVFQNEDRFLKEWLDFYRVLGVEHFYLFNNLSDDHFLDVLTPYIRAGIVELYDWPYASRPGDEADWTRIQSAAYRQGLNLAKGHSKWVAFLDTDEFMFPTEKENLTAFLKDYEECSALLINWQVFGTANVKRIPNHLLMIEVLNRQSPVQSEMNTYCKSIVRPEKVKYCVEPHSVVLYPWSYSIDPNKIIFRWKFHKSRPVNIDKIRINHYWSRDEEFFYTHKLARYENWGAKKQACLHRNEEANQWINEDIQSWVPHIRQLQACDIAINTQ